MFNRKKAHQELSWTGATLALALVFSQSTACGEGSQPPAPRLRIGQHGSMLLDGKEWRGIGVNYYDAFVRMLENPENPSYVEGFKTLQRLGIPFIRFSCGGYWPVDWKMYRETPERHFKLLDEFVRQAEIHGIGLIPSLFWHYATFPDLNGEPMDAYGDPNSKTNQFIRKYTGEVVQRYRNSPAIWGWEYGNELNLIMDIADGEKFWPHVIPSLGTAASRSERDNLTLPMIAVTMEVFAREARLHDPERPLFSGHSIMRNAAWHLWKEKKWTPDSREEYAEAALAANPEPLDTLTMHLYFESGMDYFGGPKTFDEQVKYYMELARKTGKPLFVGEFGVGKPETEEIAHQRFEEQLKAILDNQTPLSALWVFDFKGQDADYNVTETNARAYQLKAISEANRKLRADIPH